MRLFPKPISVGEEEGFTQENDLFGYFRFAKSLLGIFDKIDSPLITLLDGEWGTGKTTFVKMLSGELRKDGFPVIYFDAFENDYLDDPFIALTSEVISLAQTLELQGQSKYTKLVNAAKKTATQVTVTSAKIAAKAVTLGVLDNDSFDSLDDVASDIGKLALEKTEESLGKILESRNEQRSNIAEFKEALTGIARHLTPEEDTSPKPLIFIVDELDRCKPDFALGLVEKIKHFFQVPDVNFLLVSNFGQLAHAVKATYGAGIDADTYLQKFYDFKINLPEKKYGSKSLKYWSHALKLASEDFPLSQSDLSGSVPYILEDFIEYFCLTPREIDKIMPMFILAMLENSGNGNAFIVSLLCVIKIKSPTLFSKITVGTADISDLDDFVNFDRLALKYRSSTIPYFIDQCTSIFAEELPEKPRSRDDWSFFNNITMNKEQYLKLQLSILNNIEI